MYIYSATKSLYVKAFDVALTLLGISALRAFLVRGNVSLGMIDTSPMLVSNDVSSSLEYLSVFEQFLKKSQQLEVRNGLNNPQCLK